MQPGRENQGATPITLEPVKETSRIKKHVSSVVDRWENIGKSNNGNCCYCRITKGGKLDDLNLAPDSSPFIDSVTREDSFDQGGESDEHAMGVEGMEVVGRAVEVAGTPMGTRSTLTWSNIFHILGSRLFQVYLLPKKQVWGVW